MHQSDARRPAEECLLDEDVAISADSTDFLVIGAGSAGSVLARRLLDAGKTVTVVDAGGHDESPDIDDLARLGLLWGSAYDWDYCSEPQEGLDGRRLRIPRGKVLGGSHSLNGTIWVRGAQQDFDGWSDLGCTGWSWAEVLPYFKAMENHDGGDPDVRGRSGPLTVTTDYPHHAIQQAMYRAAVQEGVPENPDHNTGMLDGVGWMQLNVRDGRRLSTWRAYMAPVADHPRLTLITGARACRLIVRDGTVTGVELSRNGRTGIVSADEVILAAGAIGTPELLLRSGIGPAGHLRAVGIDLVQDLPGVGRNLQDHYLVPVICTTESALPVPEVTAAQVHLFARSSPDRSVPDTQPLFSSVPMYTQTAATPMTGPDSGFTLMAGMVRPASRGSLTLSGPDPEDPVRIDLAAYEQPEDLESMLFSVRQCRSIARQPALAEWGAHEIHPGPEVGDEQEELVEYIRNTTTTYHHQVGTCAMGTGPEAVVDPEDLRVHGVKGLRVADASIMPVITTGNTNAACVLIGEKAATAITGRIPC